MEYHIFIFQVPGVRIIQLEEEMAKFKPEKDEISVEALSESIDKYLEGNLKQHLLSEDLPEDWDKKPVKVIHCSQLNFIWCLIYPSIE